MIFRLPPGYDFGDSLPVITEGLRSTIDKATGGVIDVKGTGSSPPRRASTRTGLNTDGWTRTPRSLPCHSPGARRPSHSHSMIPTAYAGARAGKHPV